MSAPRPAHRTQHRAGPPARNRLSIKDIKAMLQAEIERLVRQLVPGGRREGATWSAPNPVRANDKPGSFKVWLQPAATAGAWCEYDSGEKGDVIDLIAYTQGLDRSGALRWARGFLGLGAMAPSERRQVAERASQVRQAADAEEERRAQAKARRVQEIWQRAGRVSAAPAVSAYLDHVRRVPLVDVPNPEFSFRALNDCPYVQDGFDGRSAPALVSALRDARGGVTGLHLTYVRRDGTGKADHLGKAKLMYGFASGSVIRVSRGPSGLTPEEAAIEGVSGLLIITEGIEDALTLAIEIPEARVWAAGSLGGIGAAPVAHPCVSQVIIGADNDLKPAAIDQLDRIVEKIAALRPVSVMRASAGFKDFNDERCGRRR